MFANVYQNRRVLVTGHTGFKGSWLTFWLQQLGANVVGVALEPDTDPSHYKLLQLEFPSYFIDLRDADKIDKIIQQSKPEVVFHLAAQPLVRDSYKDPLGTFATNVLGTANVLNACRNLSDLRAIVVVTSDKCYENKENGQAHSEDDPVGGYDPYSASKGCAELVTASFRNSFFNIDNYGKAHQTLIASARAGNVIGGGDWARDRLIPDVIRAITANTKVLIRNPEATRPWQHVLESLSGYLCLGEKLFSGEKQFASAWNFAPELSDQASVAEVLAKMQNTWSKVQFDLAPLLNQPHEAHLLHLDSSKAKNLLRWSGVWSLDVTIAKTINWYRNHNESNELFTLHDINAYIKDARKLQLPWALE